MLCRQAFSLTDNDCRICGEDSSSGGQIISQKFATFQAVRYFCLAEDVAKYCHLENDPELQAQNISRETFNHVAAKYLSKLCKDCSKRTAESSQLKDQISAQEKAPLKLENQTKQSDLQDELGDKQNEPMVYSIEYDDQDCNTTTGCDIPASKNSMGDRKKIQVEKNAKIKPKKPVRGENSTNDQAMNNQTRSPLKYDQIENANNYLSPDSIKPADLAYTESRKQQVRPVFHKSRPAFPSPYEQYEKDKPNNYPIYSRYLHWLRPTTTVRKSCQGINCYISSFNPFDVSKFPALSSLKKLFGFFG